MKLNTSDDQLMAMQMSYTELTKRFMSEGFDEFACAAIMIKISLMIYKSALSEEEYNLIVDEISSSRDHVKSFEQATSEAQAMMGKLN